MTESAAIPPERRSMRVLAVLAVLTSTGALAAVVAFWGWHWLGPPPERVPASGPADPALALAASGLFAGRGAAPEAAPAPESTMRSGETRLLGMFAETNGKGFALFRLPNGTKLVAAGQEIAQGATLVAVRPDGVTVRDAGGERTILLRASPAPSAVKAPTVASAGPTVRNAACMPPAGFKGDVLRLNAELASGIVAQPDTWAVLAAADRGALTIRDDSGFSTMLAMKKGDRVEQGNGIALRAPDDIVNAVLKPLIAGQPVRLIGARAGVPHEWLLLNAGTCP